MSELPSHFLKMQDRYGNVMEKLKELADATDKAGPIEAKTAHLIQIAGAAFFGAIVIAELSGLKAPTFSFDLGWIIFALAGLVMLFEAWRTKRKKKDQKE